MERGDVTVELRYRPELSSAERQNDGIHHQLIAIARGFSAERRTETGNITSVFPRTEHSTVRRVKALNAGTFQHFIVLSSLYRADAGYLGGGDVGSIKPALPVRHEEDLTKWR